jgi:hypothetical protein
VSLGHLVLEFDSLSRVGLAQLVKFLVVELTHPDSNPRFDMSIVFTAKYFFQLETTSLLTTMRSW